ncbi:3-deoxy-manno-octulosonate cytidylyltransferase [Pelagibacteraceae bacterium]|jgi:3-deoxy-manno-octulosonate cytidylyltransferase (CMP-KDO synthetase)|nr:3-deoxy-manno-octulosonate cytidylyltransferase [Pelagibacteraceae bacterium]
MKNTAIIIPSRLNAKRFPNKPLAEINNIPMIVHVLNRAKETKLGEVIVATPDNEICNVVNENGGKAVLTKHDHNSGSDRVYEVYLRELKDKVDLIINLQGDMPNITPESILKLDKLMRENNCSIGTLAADLKERNDVKNSNVVKVHVEQSLKNNDFIEAKDFFRTKKDLKNQIIYHHIGIYAFTNNALAQYVKLSRSKLEIERNLEQMRAMENNLSIKVGLCNSIPLGIDTEEDLVKVSKEMKMHEK